MHHNGWAEVFGADASGFKVPALFESCAFAGSPLAVVGRLILVFKERRLCIISNEMFKIAQNDVFFSWKMRFFGKNRKFYRD